MSASKHSGGPFDLTTQQERLEEIKAELSAPDVWQDQERATALNQERATIEKLIEPVMALQQSLQDVDQLLEMAPSEPEAAELATEELAQLEQQLASAERAMLFTQELDRNNCFLEIQAGSGGTEAQDWAAMLLRMYLRWADSHGFTTELTDEAPGEVAGIKGATIHVVGPYAYGWLRTESGVHRLVRKSPFDAGARRHTSFAGVHVTPEVDTKIDIEINPADLRVDVYRASGAGGQHVNRTESAVRITHLPTGIVVQCQNDRSQHKNRATAMNQLRAKLFQFEERKRQAAAASAEALKPDIGWGQQIRSYVLDQSRIKDLRTGLETGNPQAVLDGGLDEFIEATLRHGFTQNSTRSSHG
jgi:peptide chain release factor 2